ncbi:anthranilate synthase component II [Hyphococcus sp. DH-69]|uniref:anthranilate synthase component II n=1 Tax=Hyphococcus formosus TaxID=3143534 RepID=UPI00398A9348
MILLIDNYDSFTFNLVHLIGELGEDTKVVRNDALTAQEAIAMGAEAIVLSPGPCTPNEAGICLDLVDAAKESGTPIFGVCLGMQSITQSFGGIIKRAGKLMHGKTCEIIHDGGGVFAEMPSPFTAVRYHSLVADRASLSKELTITAQADDDNEIMAVAHRSLPIVGVQFHPESIATEYGAKMFSNFLTDVRAK